MFCGVSLCSCSGQYYPYIMTQLRDTILQIATREFVSYGIRSVSVDDICNKLHISKKTFYTEFKQKDDLVRAVLENIHNDSDEHHCKAMLGFENAIDAVMHFRNPLVQASIKTMEKFHYDLDKYYSVIRDEFMSGRKDKFIDNSRKLIEWGIADGLFRSDIDVALSAVMAVEWFMLSVNREGRLEGYSKEVLMQSFADAFLRAVTTPKGWEYYTSTYFK